MRWHELTTSSHSLIWRCFLFVSANMCFSWWDLTPPLEEHGGRVRKSEEEYGKAIGKAISLWLQIKFWSAKMPKDNSVWTSADGRCPGGKSTRCIYKIKFSLRLFPNLPSQHLNCLFLCLSALHVLSHFDLCICFPCLLLSLRWHFRGKMDFLLRNNGKGFYHYCRRQVNNWGGNEHGEKCHLLVIAIV